MSKKKRKKQIAGTTKTCYSIAVVGIVLGVVSILFGLFLYKNIMSPKDIHSGTAKVTSVEKVERNLSASDQKIERDKGRTEDQIRYEYLVGYSLVSDDREYTYTDTRPLWLSTPQEGDTDAVSYAIVDGNLILHPETRGTNQFTICGVFLLVFGLVFGAIGLFIGKK